MMLDDVNILMGTDSTFDLSHGNTLPLVARPFGMAHWSMQTAAEGGWFFHPANPKLQGIRLTHQPSPWIADYGAFTLMPQAGPCALPAKMRASSYRRAESVLRPDFLKLRFLRGNIGMEMTPTERGALFVFQFSGEGTNRLILEPEKGESSATVLPVDRRLVGFTRGRCCPMPDNFACHYVLEFSQPIVNAGTMVAGKPPGGLRAEGERAGAWVEFPDGAITVEARVATSFLSVEQARVTLSRELAGRGLPELRAAAETAWREVLGRVEIETCNGEWRRTFASCLWRCFLFPRVFHEVDATGATVHYGPGDGKQHPGPLYCDTGFWDTYRTQFPLLNLLDRRRSGEMLEGFLNHFRAGGWLPQWSAPGYLSAMIGTHSESVFTHALECGITGFDAETAWRALWRNCMEPPDRAGVGRAGLAAYLELGYCPADTVAEATSRTLDYAYNDFCAGRVAARLGHRREAELLARRAQNYRKVFDPSVNFMRGRNRDGSWATFHPFAWGGPYVEGGPWQSTWAVPHDPDELIALMGGRARFLAKLDEMLATPPRFLTGTYVQEIHEMTEMALADFGQYAHSNQPVHHVLWFYTLAGAPEKNRHWVRRVLTELYHPTERGFCGDEDNGEMSAWYVLAALGLFPFCPGNGRLVTGGMLFDRAMIRPAGAGTITIEPLPGSASIPTWNGKPLEDFQLRVTDAAQGGALRLPTLEKQT